MPNSFSVRLPHRGVIALTGDDRVTFLNGLVTNDISAVTDGAAVWTAFLTPQGKVIADLFVVPGTDADGTACLFLETDADRLDDLRTRLGRFRLRAKVTLTVTDLKVAAASAAPATLPGVTAFADPRHPDAGVRLIGPDSALPPGTAADLLTWQRHRLSLGLPEGSADLSPEQGFALEYGFDDLNGVDFRKGCFIGQETTARMKWKHLTRKRLLPVRLDGPALPAGTPVLDNGGIEVGTLRSAVDDGQGGTLALAMLKLAPVKAGSALTADGIAVTVTFPNWVKLPPDAA